jgi:uncharacterized protein (DUF58 family)
MNRQAWRDFFITVFFLGIAFIIALLSSVAADQRNGRLAAVAAAVSLLLALVGAIYIIPRLARNIRLEILRFAIRTTVTVEGLLFVVFLMVIAFAAWNTGNNLLYLVLSAMLAFLVAANLIARISLGDMSVQLRFPDHIFASEPASIAVTLVNHKRLMPSYSLMVEALSEKSDDDEEGESKSRKAEEGRGKPGHRQPGGKPAPSARAYPPAHLAAAPPIGKLAYFVLAPAKSSVRQRIEHTFERRGRYPITGFRIATKFPAGFFKKWKRIEAAGEIIVYPKPQPLDDFYHALPMLAGQMESHARGSGDDLYAIRRYHPSDHMRNIDWKATAKSLEMMVREHTREDEWRLTIVFDTLLTPAPISRPAAAGDKEGDSKEGHSKEGHSKADDLLYERFERAVVMAASLANHFILERADVELITLNSELNVPSGTGQEHLYKILRSLAMLQAALPPAERADAKAGRLRRGLFGRRRADEARQPAREGTTPPQAGAAIAWRLLEDVPVLADERRFKVLITSAVKGTIPAHVWRSAHVVFMEDL